MDGCPNFLVYVLYCALVVWSIPFRLFFSEHDLLLLIDPEIDNPFPMPGVRYVRV